MMTVEILDHPVGSASADDGVPDILARHRPRIHRLGSARLAGSDDVDDVVQQVFLSALKNLEGSRGQAHLAGWLTTIAINKCRSHWRKLQAWRKALAGATGAPTRPPPPRPEAVAMKREAIRRVRRAVHALPQPYREVVALRYLDQTPAPAVAKALDVPPPLVKLHLHRARKRLKSLLADLAEE